MCDNSQSVSIVISSIKKLSITEKKYDKRKQKIYKMKLVGLVEGLIAHDP